MRFGGRKKRKTISRSSDYFARCRYYGADPNNIIAKAVLNKEQLPDEINESKLRLRKLSPTYIKNQQRKQEQINRELSFV